MRNSAQAMNIILGKIGSLELVPEFSDSPERATRTRTPAGQSDEVGVVVPDESIRRHRFRGSLHGAFEDAGGLGAVKGE